MNLLQKLREAHGVKDNEDDVFDTRNHREPYYDYMMRRSREEDAKLKAQEELEKNKEIIELKERITKLEIDMAHMQAEQQTIFGDRY